MRLKTLPQEICWLRASVGIDGKRVGSTLHKGVFARLADQDPGQRGLGQDSHSDRPSFERCQRMIPTDL